MLFEVLSRSPFSLQIPLPLSMRQIRKWWAFAVVFVEKTWLASRLEFLGIFFSLKASHVSELVRHFGLMISLAPVA